MKKFLCLMLSITLALTFFGCQAASKGPVFGIILMDPNNAYTQKILEGYQLAVGELGGSVRVVYADTVETQIDALETMQKEGITAIALRPADTTGLEDALRNAKAAGISVATVDSDTRGSAYFLNQADIDLVAQALVEEIYTLTGGAGEFAVLSGSATFSGSDFWVNAMTEICRQEKYRDLIWVQTSYAHSDDPNATQEETLALLEAYPELEVICCTGTYATQGCAMALNNVQTNVKVTGLAKPSDMQDLVGEDRPCASFFLWNPLDIGQCCGYVLDAAREGKIGAVGTSFQTKNEQIYSVGPGLTGETTIPIGPPYKFDSINITQWADIY